MEGVETALKAAEKRQKDAEENCKKFKSGLAGEYSKLDAILVDIRAQKKELGNIARSLMVYKDSFPKEKSADFKARLRALEHQTAQLKLDYEPETGSLFVRFFLGRVNVKHHRDFERIILKKEYEKFKERTNFLFIFFVALQIWIFPGLRPLEILFQVWLAYYYTSLALRENILRVNGSNIKTWWIIHHYFSILVSLTFLLWPPGESYYYYLPQFLWFSFVQGVVQTLVNRYQSAQLYKQVAMGKASRMDVTGHAWEGIEGTVSGKQRGSSGPSALALLPFLLFFQILQISMGFTMLRDHLLEGTHPPIQWQVIAIGILFVFLGLGNMMTTLYTYRRNGFFSLGGKRPGAQSSTSTSASTTLTTQSSKS